MTILRNAGLRAWPWILVAAAALAGCGPKAVRGDEVAGLDDQAMSTGLDRRDLQKLLKENLDTLQNAAVVKRWEQENRPAVAVLPLRNETSEHIDSALEALISDIETALVNAGHVRVVSLEQQPALMQEVKQQQSDAYNPQQVARWGKQIGAQYLVTGKVFTTDERFEDERRVQYSLFMQVLDVETGEVLFQNKSAVTKALVN
ncbi:MAG: penicillin-binding protein activator LpoB [Polyangiaceae bacterium]|nr:penicillin-binding protein activator LpoB [Polyangiaceae bacterium]